MSVEIFVDCTAVSDNYKKEEGRMKFIIPLQLKFIISYFLTNQFSLFINLVRIASLLPVGCLAATLSAR